MRSVDVVIPYRGGCPHRERALAWVRERYEANHPDWRLVVAEASPGPWIKAAAVNSAVRCSAAELIVVADADIWSDGLPQTVEAIESGAGWAIPHRGVFRLTEASTARLLAGDENYQAMELTERAYRGMDGGGFVVARRETLLEVPMDERFVGWGQEDESHALALRCLVGHPWRGRATLVHLWHPPQERIDRRRGSRENWRLMMRYQAARRDPAATRALLEEVTVCSPI